MVQKGAGLIDFIRSPNRLQYPQVREAGSNEWKRLSWDDALTRIARMVGDDRDANFIEKNEAGQTVNRWLTTGFLAASAASSEAGYMTHKVVRSLGIFSVSTTRRAFDTVRRWQVLPLTFGRGAMTNHWSDIKTPTC